MANSYAKGDTIRMSGAFTVSSVATDPTTVTLVIETPAGVETTYTYALSQVTKASTGSYYKDIALTESGYYKYRWTGTGAVATVGDDTYIYVKDSVFA
jgi:hypothetical protein